MNSTEVAAELKCVKPPLVRQIGHRARQIGDEIIGGKIHAEKWNAEQQEQPPHEQQEQRQQETKGKTKWLKLE